MFIINFLEQYPYFSVFLFGLVPALIWLWFWLKEDLHPEPAKMITLAFLGGMMAVVIVLPLQKLIYDYISGSTDFSFFLWAGLEEFFKFSVVYFVVLRNKKINDEPIDDVIYLIISALGFTALENTFFMFDMIGSGTVPSMVLTGNMRFLGASLLHIMSSSVVGISLALAYYKSTGHKIFNGIFGLLLATLLHACFNLFIIKTSENYIFLIFGMVWLAIIVVLFFIEKIKHMVVGA